MLQKTLPIILLFAAFQANALIISYNTTFDLSPPSVTDNWDSNFQRETRGGSVDTDISLTGFDTSLGTLNSASFSLDSVLGYIVNASPEKPIRAEPKGQQIFQGYGEMWTAFMPFVSTTGGTRYEEFVATARCYLSTFDAVLCSNPQVSLEYAFGDKELTLLSQAADQEVTVGLSSRLVAWAFLGEQITDDVIQVTDGYWRGTVSIHYDYTPAPEGDDDGAAVPEPSIFALMGIGLAGLGFARRRNIQDSNKRDGGIKL